MKTQARILERWLALGCAAVVALLPFTLRAANGTNAPGVAKSPDWLRSAVVYEVFPRQFSAAGNLAGVTARLDELKDLGVDVLWIMPIHPIGEKQRKGTLGSPYAVRDYHAINPDYGTAADFKALVQGAHQRDMKVIMDIVAGHTAWDNVLITKHPEFYKRNAAGEIIPPNPEWSDVAALDYDNPALRRFMVDMLKYWLREFNVDGFRCDVAFTVPIEFWESARAELEAVHPELIMLADANAQPALLARAFNMDNSGAFHSALGRVMSGLSPATLLRQSWETTKRQFPPDALHLRFTDRHESTRAVARFGLSGALAAQVLMLTLDGVPMFYNGMEVGDATESADPALFERLPIYWSPGGRPPLRDIYRSLIRLRKTHSAFTASPVRWLDNSAPAEVVTFLRADDKDEFVICVNLSSRTVAVSVPVDKEDQFQPVKIDGMPTPPGSSLPEFRLEGYGWRIYHRPLKSTLN